MMRELSFAATSKLCLPYARPVAGYSNPAWNKSLQSEQTITIERIQASVARRRPHASWYTLKLSLLKTVNLVAVN